MWKKRIIVCGASLVGGALVAACASSSAATSTAAGSGASSPAPVTKLASRRAPSGCTMPAADTTFASVEPVYRPCDVDQQALPLDTTFDAQGIGLPIQSCLSAEVEFVIGKNGIPLYQPVKVIKSNSLDFTRVLLHAISRWRYQPALKDGHPVRQLEQVQAAAQVEPSNIPAGPPSNPNSDANIGPTTC